MLSSGNKPLKGGNSLDSTKFCQENARNAMDTRLEMGRRNEGESVGISFILGEAHFRYP